MKPCCGGRSPSPGDLRLAAKGRHLHMPAVIVRPSDTKVIEIPNPHVPIWKVNGALYHPQPTFDGGSHFPGRSDVRMFPDGLIVQKIRSKPVERHRLLSGGVMEKGVYRPLWKPGVMTARFGAFFQPIGPFLNALYVRADETRSVVLLSEFPEVPGGDALAFEWASDFFQPDAHWRDSSLASGPIDVTLTERGFIRSLPFSVLEGLSYPVDFDPAWYDRGYIIEWFAQWFPASYCGGTCNSYRGWYDSGAGNWCRITNAAPTTTVHWNIACHCTGSNAVQLGMCTSSDAATCGGTPRLIFTCGALEGRDRSFHGNQNATGVDGDRRYFGARTVWTGLSGTSSWYEVYMYDLYCNTAPPPDPVPVTPGGWMWLIGGGG